MALRFLLLLFAVSPVATDEEAFVGVNIGTDLRYTVHSVQFMLYDL